MEVYTQYIEDLLSFQLVLELIKDLVIDEELDGTQAALRRHSCGTEAALGRH